MALNTSVSNVGTWCEPLATALLLVLGWRQIFFRRHGRQRRHGPDLFFSVITGCRIARVLDVGLVQGFASYESAENRNMVIASCSWSRCRPLDGGVNQIYFAPHLANDFRYSNLNIGILITAISIGSIAGRYSSAGRAGGAPGTCSSGERV